MRTQNAGFRAFVILELAIIATAIALGISCGDIPPGSRSSAGSIAYYESGASETNSSYNPTGSTSSAPSTSTSSSSYKPSSTTSSTSTTFTNKYGTPTTKCAHAGCNNYIASSGDTNCCTTHSNRCGKCGKYIDEDAMYCMDCLKAATTSSSSSSSSYSSGSSYSGGSSSSSSSHECYVCGKSASEKVGSYWYCSTHAAWVRAASG